MSTVRDEPCPKCREQGRDRTGNHLQVFEDGNKSCNRCGYKEIKKVIVSMETVKEVSEYPILEIKKRGISKGITDKYSVRTSINEETGEKAKLMMDEEIKAIVEGE